MVKWLNGSMVGWSDGSQAKSCVLACSHLAIEQSTIQQLSLSQNDRIHMPHSRRSESHGAGCQRCAGCTQIVDQNYAVWNRFWTCVSECILKRGQAIFPATVCLMPGWPGTPEQPGQWPCLLLSDDSPQQFGLIESALEHAGPVQWNGAKYRCRILR